ncbi:MAG: sodium:proton antiporter [Rikenellaceae bacterium]|jgi:CPA1 family monovalent cation:H+ antiporter|nr:sodium:proton antiporter [Rikenellaceae bacterium]
MERYGIVILLLALSVGFSAVAPRVRLPYPVFLLLAGVGLGFIPEYHDFSIPPDVVFLIFLPAMLYHAAADTSIKDFRANFNVITLLAIALVFLTVIAIAVIAHSLVPGIDWPLAFLLGGILAPPDAIAALGVTRGLGLPHQTANILESEGLVNDASALVACRFAQAAVMGGAFVLWRAGLEFIYIMAVGCLVGFLLGYLFRFMARRFPMNNASMVSFNVLLPFVAYWLADVAHASGVLAVVVMGLMMAHDKDKLLSREAAIQADAVWNAISTLLGALVFVLLGIKLPAVISNMDNSLIPWMLLCAFAIFIVAWIIRTAILGFYKIRLDNALFMMRYMPGRLSRRAKARAHNLRPMRWREVIVIGWAGMRGIISLAIALAIPEKLPSGAPFPGRDMIIFLTVTTVIIMLVVQGVGLGPLLKWVKLNDE